MINQLLPRRESTFVGALVICTVLNTTASAGVDDHKIACGGAEKAQVAAAMEQARKDAIATIEKLDAADPTTLMKFNRWLGAPTPTALATAKAHYDRVVAFSGFGGVWCPVANSAEFGWNVGDFAGVHPDAPSDIFFAPQFFQAGATGLDSQASTALHEALHTVGVLPEGAEQEVYAIPKLEALAKQNQAAALRNAQSFEYLTTDLLYGGF